MPVNHVIYDNKTLIDLRSDTVTPDTLAEGSTAHDAAGNKIAGTMKPSVTLTSISVTTPPTKTTYTAGDTFDPAGMVVAATYTNGTQIEVGGYLFSPNTELKIGDSVVTVYYAEAGVSVSTTISITVEKRYDDVFANNTWAQIIEACERNEVPETWVVGNNKLMSIGGKDYRMDIIGKKHDTYTAGGIAPLTFQMHDSYVGGKQMNTTATNAGGWRDSVMRNVHLPALLYNLPAEVIAGIKEVNKKTTTGSTGTSVVTTADKLFLLSEVEIFGTTTYSQGGEGSRYAYYAAGNSAAKTTNGNVNVWWERSPYRYNTTDFCRVGGYGTPSYDTATSDPAIAFAFCF